MGDYDPQPYQPNVFSYFCHPELVVASHQVIGIRQQGAEVLEEGQIRSHSACLDPRVLLTRGQQVGPIARVALEEHPALQLRVVHLTQSAEHQAYWEQSMGQKVPGAQLHHPPTQEQSTDQKAPVGPPNQIQMKILA